MASPAVCQVFVNFPGLYNPILFQPIYRVFPATLAATFQNTSPMWH